MKKILCFLLVISFCLFTPMIFAQQEPVTAGDDGNDAFEIKGGIGVKLGTFGPGLEFVMAVHPKVHVRLNGSYFSIKYDTEIDSWHIDGELQTKTGGVMLAADYYIVKSVFVTGGLAYMFTEQSIKGLPNQGYRVGVLDITPEKIGNVTIKMTPNKIAPYLGLGFGTTLSHDGIVGVSLELGALYMGSPSTEITAEGMLYPTAAREQEEIIDGNIKSLQFYPYITFGLSFKIF